MSRKNMDMSEPGIAIGGDNSGIVAGRDVIIQRAVKPLPSGGGYKAHLNWNFDFPAFVC